MLCQRLKVILDLLRLLSNPVNDGKQIPEMSSSISLQVGAGHGGSWDSGPLPPPHTYFWGPSNFIKKGFNVVCVHAYMRHNLVLTV